MDAARVIAGTTQIKSAFYVLATVLQLTAFLFYQEKCAIDGSEFDFIVVGAGSAGSVVAARLSEDPYTKVLLIEAGGDPPIEAIFPGLVLYNHNSHVDWNFTSRNDHYTMQTHPNMVAKLDRGRMLGGTSGLNYMFYVRGHPYDYDHLWTTASGDDTWSYENVLPYFKKSERLEDEEILSSQYRRYHGTKGNLGVIREIHPETFNFLETMKSSGFRVLLDINGEDNFGFSQVMFTVANGIRQSTAISFLHPALKRENLCILKHTLATKIIFDSKRTARAVKVLTDGGTSMSFKAKKEIIVSAGALQSPHLLMLSGVGPKNHLQSLKIPVVQDLPVGENLQDHLLAVLVYTAEPSTASPPLSSIVKVPLISVNGFDALDKNITHPDVQITTVISPSNSEVALSLCLFILGFNDEICQVYYEANKGRNLVINLIGLLHPQSRGKILLSSKDPRKPPLFYMGYYSNDADLQNHVNYLKYYNNVFLNSDYYKELNSQLVDPLVKCKKLEPDSEEYWRCYALGLSSTSYHYTSSCSMGSCSSGAVVDSRLRVCGVQRLRVVDASAIPFITGGNPNAPTIMLAEKASDMIKEDNNIKTNNFCDNYT